MPGVVFVFSTVLTTILVGAAVAQLPVDLGPADQHEVDGFVLTRDTLLKVVEINTRIASQLAEDPSWRRQLSAEARAPGGQSLAEAVKRLLTQPRIVTWLEGAGLAPRTYLVAQLALLQAAVTDDNVKAGLARLPPLEAGARRRNLAFVEANPVDLRRFLSGVEQISTLLDEAWK